MRGVIRKSKIEYGDFQTPPELASAICRKLVTLGISPQTIVEPTCGVGAFVEAAARSFPSARRIWGFDVNEEYVRSLSHRLQYLPHSNRILIQRANFFEFNWQDLLKEANDPILVIGNFPWVTNAQVGALGGANLPPKDNFAGAPGLEAMTGASNFDISEWMLVKMATWLASHNGCLAMLCKTAVARKIMKHLHTMRIGWSRAAIFGIDAKRSFGVSVEACLLFAEFDPDRLLDDYEVYDSLEAERSSWVGHRNGVTVRDLDLFEHHKQLRGKNPLPWRSGIKHDCASVLELRESNELLVNGLGEILDIEPLLLYPLQKGADLANNRALASKRYLLLPQQDVGEDTRRIQQIAPKTWKYLEAHSSYFDNRKSRVYKPGIRFSIFGVGPYAFAPYKVAICSLYKKLEFRLVEPMHGKPVVFDDTVYYLSFASRIEAERALFLISSTIAREFLSSLIFWDDKRPIKTKILNCLELAKVETALALA